MERATIESIRTDIFNTITTVYGIKILGHSQIKLGYMNLKWKLDTDRGGLFVKQYNKTRYPEKMIDGLETSLRFQSQLHKKGIPCPRLFSHNERFIMQSPNGERFVLMELSDGKLIKAGTANLDQMYSLGQITGKMHQILNASNTAKSEALHWNIPSKESMLADWNKRWNEAHMVNCHDTLTILEKQR